MTPEHTDTDTGQKEQHRVGTIGRWDPPEADWAAECDWTRYRGPDAYPVPGDWVLDVVEADGIIWNRYPSHGDGHASDNDVWDSLDGDEEYHDVREEMAALGHEVVNPNAPVEGWEYEQQMLIGTTDVFRRVEPDRDELAANAAKVLAAVDDGTDLEDIDVDWESGRELGEVPGRDDSEASLGDYS